MEGLLRIRKGYRLLKAKCLKLVALEGRTFFTANYTCKSVVLVNKVTVSECVTTPMNKQIKTLTEV